MRLPPDRPARRPELLQRRARHGSQVVVRLDELNLGVVAELRKHLDELELVDEVVLEPEDDPLRSCEQLVAARELRVDRVLAPPPVLGEEARAERSRLLGVEGERPDVQHVVPREDDALERGGAEGARHRLPVRDVQRAHAQDGVAAAAGEVGGVRRAPLERLPHLVQRPHEARAPRPQRGDRGVDVLELAYEPLACRLGCGARIAAGQPQVLLDLGEREAEALRLLHRPDEPDRVGVVLPVPALAARRLRQEPAALVVAQRLDVDARALCDLADPHGPTVEPDLGPDCKPAQYLSSPQDWSFSRRSRRNRPASAPSTSRWSYVSVRFMIGRIAITSWPCSSCTTHGRLTTA